MRCAMSNIIEFIYLISTALPLCVPLSHPLLVCYINSYVHILLYDCELKRKLAATICNGFNLCVV